MIKWEAVLLGFTIVIMLYNYYLSYKQARVYDKVSELVDINNEMLHIMRKKR